MATGTRRRYTEDFKQEAVRLVRESARPVAQVARDLGIPENVLYRWRTQHRQATAQGTTCAAQHTEAEELRCLKAGVGPSDPGAGFFTTCGGVLREGIAMRCRAIQEHDRRYPIRLMCRALAVSPAGYYAWRDRPESRRATQNRTLLSSIRVLHRKSRETYGSPSIWSALSKQGHAVGKQRVARLMRQAGLRAKTARKWRATTQSQHRFPVAKNTLDRQFTVTSPNRVWAGDITYDTPSQRSPPVWV